MYSQELVQAVIEERSREAAALQRQRQARDLLRRAASPGSDSPRGRTRRLPFASFVARAFRTASVQ